MGLFVVFQGFFDLLLKTLTDLNDLVKGRFRNIADTLLRICEKINK